MTSFHGVDYLLFPNSSSKLIEYAIAGNLEKVRDHLGKEEDVNVKNEHGNTALVWASNNGNLEIVRALLMHNGVDVNIKDHAGASALYYASYNGHVEVVRALLNHYGVDVNIKDNDGDTPLICASLSGHLEVVRALLMHNGVDVNIQTNHGDTALMWATFGGHEEVVRALLNHDGVNVNIQNNDGRTALILASRKGHLDVVRALLHHDGVDVNVRDEYGYTALDIARMKPKVGVARLLEEHMERLKLHVEKIPAGNDASRRKGRRKRLKVTNTTSTTPVDVNLQSSDGKTALHMASQNGLVEVVRALVQLNNVDVNMMDKHGATALILASEKGNLEVVRALLDHPEVDVNIQNNDGETALGVARKRQNEKVSRLLLNRQPVDDQIEHDRSKLLHVMKTHTPSADPVELSLEYIQRCLTDNKLGKGAYGDVFLAEDSHLPKKFAVKMIHTTTLYNEAAIKEMRRSFQMELFTLKTFRHPNIIALYGYSLNANSTQQCLVYEHAANGSLSDFFNDDGNRARLPSDVRLSIMYEMVRAVHFLHTGGCKVDGKGWKVFHRDIKSANICLMDDFTPRLIDFGLAKFVPDDSPGATLGSSTVTLQSTTGGFALGTPGYMCPVYVKKKARGHLCPYIAAYDVYSIGIVLVELILGCLNGVRSTRNDSPFLDVLETYVQEERTSHRVVDGWEKLMGDADPTIIWNPGALELLCKAAIQCMDPFPEERLSTKDLLDKLRDAINLNTSAGTQHPVAASAVDSGPYCLVCNKYRADIKCSEGHALCTFCIMDELYDENGCQLVCLIKECSSKLHYKDLYGRLPIETYKRYVDNVEERRCRQELLNRGPAGSGADHRVAVELHRRDDDSLSIDDAKMEQDRTKLLHVMNTPSADPVELSLEYIEQCIKKDHKLGSGAFGDVFLAEDSRLTMKFAVKMMRTNSKCNEAGIKEMRRSFKRELSALKAFRHPNIIALYGYSLNANSTQQCLVYEHAANGSLSDFFNDEGNRARLLLADIRLSIMFQLVRAVHFLHTGGCKVAGKSWKVFHRDIKSANICLAENFTPRLIDCGLAKFVPDDNSRAYPEPFPVSLRSATGGFAFGTPGYICPNYLMKKFARRPYPYIAAYDVYSIGVVLVELILGCLNAGQSTRNDSQFLDVFEKYVQEERTYERIVDGWEKLKRDADPTIMWNPDALELVCKAAIRCMDPFPEERLSTKDLLDHLSDAILLNNNTGIQHPQAVRAENNGPLCLICNNYRTEITCRDEGHALCTFCILDNLGHHSGGQLFCLIKECSSEIRDLDLYGRIPVEMYNRFVERRDESQI